MSLSAASRGRLALAVGVLALSIAMIASLLVGAAAIDPSSVARALFGGAPALSPETAVIVREIRLPRALAAALVGGTLALTGASLQAAVRNPLAEPYVLGVSSGASLGAAAAVVAFRLGTGDPRVALSAFAAAAASVLVVHRIAAVGGRILPVRLLLAGVAVSSLTAAATGFILYLAPEPTAARGVLFWLLGGLGGVDWAALGWTALVAVPACLALVATARAQNQLLLGDEAALSLGLDVTRARRALVLLSALATGAVVSASGTIGFLGLVVPHALRGLVGADHRRLLGLCFLFGAALLVAMDVLARALLAPEELPVGILTGLIGGPFFLGLLGRLGEDGDG